MEIQSDIIQSIDESATVTLSSYTPHGTIDVIGDAELAAVSVSGTGWGFDPYILEGWNITTSGQHGIRIRDTTMHFVIQDCWITTNDVNNWRAIWIENTTAGTVRIENNICVGSILGIDLDACENATVRHNQCLENRYGIWLDDSDGSILTNNTCSFSMTYGIYVDSSPYCELDDNICSYSNWNKIHGTTHGMGRGIHVTNSPYSVFYNNTCTNNEYDSLRLYQSPSSVLRFNNITGGHYFGIYLGSSQDSTVSNNTVTYTTDIGIYATESDDIIVANNTAERNEEGGIHVTHCASAIVIDNTMVEDGLRLYGSTVADYESMTVSGNSINNKPFGFFLNTVDDTISTDYGQLLLVNCTNALIIWQNCSFATLGIELKWCSGCSVTLSSFNNNDYVGFQVSSSNHTTIMNTSCNENRVAGGHLQSSYNTSVIETTISNSRIGIQLDSHNLRTTLYLGVQTMASTTI
jgi:parallel beta-helix repeat protein